MKIYKHENKNKRGFQRIKLKETKHVGEWNLPFFFFFQTSRKEKEKEKEKKKKKKIKKHFL